MTRVIIPNIFISPNSPPILIAGPCVIENEALTLEIAYELKRICADKEIPLIFKASYAKANRSSAASYIGPGMRAGLRILEKVKAETGLPILTDVHETAEVEFTAEIVDILQIPAFLCRQTELVQTAARTGKPLNIKKGQFMSPQQMKLIAEKAVLAGSDKVMLTERGTFFGYSDLVVDMRSLPIMASYGYPVLFDATHSVQQPGGLGSTSGGLREFILPLARAAAATGAISGLYLETHPEPEKSPSDAASMLPFDRLPAFLDSVWAIFATKL
ncbi:MAG: 3-deoxy-8-phosphooctulonate synthase [candidate division Zixibacteria bacterium]|nr:3-deoxy-8-phosphooctulonate synthase [Candidatus Tariuqbacter arcticus]